MSGGVKFLFDTDFQDVDPSAAFAQEAAEKAPVFSQEQLEAAREEGRGEGRQDGRREALQELEAAAQAALQRVAAALEQMRLAQVQRWSEAVAVAVLVARKIAAAAIEAAPLAEVEATIETCLDEFREEPRVVIRVHEPLVETLAARLDAIIERHGLTADIVVLGDDGLAKGDCRIEWADGGAERIGAQLEAAVEEAVQRHLTAPTDHFPDPSDPDRDGE